MKIPYSYFLLCAFIFLLAFLTSCNGQSKINAPTNNAQIATAEQEAQLETQQIGEYLVTIFEDNKGHLWFGTMSKGVARYDGQALSYFSIKDGLPDNAVVSITQDKKGNMWFGTHSGLSKYDGFKFTNYTTADGLCHHRVSNILFDRAGNFWIGTWGGVCQFNPSTEQFSDFPLPIPNIEVPNYQETANWVTEIIEDQQGNIWIGRSGYGAVKYNPNKTKSPFTQYTKADGLASNCVQDIQQDRKGNFWFGSRVAEKDHPDPDLRKGEGGLTKLHEPKQRTTKFPDLAGLSKNDIYSIYMDKAGNIWVGAIGIGLYRYDGQRFTLYNEIKSKSPLNDFGFGIQGLLEDRQGRLWVGLSGGLFRLDGSSLVNITQDGPW